MTDAAVVLPPAPAHPHRLVYLGTPEMAVAPLEALLAARFEVALVVSRVDKRRGRGSELTPSPVKAAARRLGLTVSQRVDDVLGVGADLGVVVAFGQLIRPHVLAGLPMVNLHFSLLPRWRGAAPVERAILAGDAQTGVCLMRVEEGLDTGGVYARATVPIGERSADELRAELVTVGTALLVDTLRNGLGSPVEQVGEPVYAHRIAAAEMRIDWNRPAGELARLVRLGQAWTTFRGRRLKVLVATVESGGGPAVGEPDSLASAGAPGTIVGQTVAAAPGALRLVTVQPEGRSAMAAEAWLNGSRPAPGDRLGS